MKRIMKNIATRYITIIAIGVALLCGCTDGEETMSWKPGTKLHIVGPGALEVGEDAEYYVDGYTIDETYTWKLDGNAITPTRNGLAVELEFDAAAAHVLTVSNGKLEGTMDITVE